MPGSAPLRLVVQAADPTTTTAVLRFGRFELLCEERQLRIDGQAVPLRARALDVLIALAATPGRLVSRQQLLDAVWKGVVVEDGNLSVQINALRRVLGGEVIVTVPGYGYRFMLPAPADAADECPASGDTPRQPESGLAAPAPNLLPTHLPASLPALIGRDHDLKALDALVDTHALVTLVGVTGMGKTRLVQTLLQGRKGRYEHGVCFVELAGVTTPEAVVPTVAASIGVRLRGASDTAEALAYALAPLELLVSLDNAEHLIDSVAHLVATLAAKAPRVKLLVTSQAPLRVRDEQVYRLRALAVPPVGTAAPAALRFGAVALFAQRARAADLRFALTDANIPLAIELCRRLDGVPLAIELAAARAPLLGMPQLVASLDERLRLLTGGRRDAPPRHRTLRAALAWSHELLGPVEQIVFRRLAVFVGGASLALVCEVVTDALPATPSDTTPAVDTWQVLDALDTLVDRSLVALTGDAETPRFQLLDSPLALARERLQAAGEAALLQQRHALAVQALFESADARLFAGESGLLAWRATLNDDIANAQAALQWQLRHEPVRALGLASVLSRALEEHRHGERELLWAQMAPLLDDTGLVPRPPALGARAAYENALHLSVNHRRSGLARAQQAHAGFSEADDRQGRYLAVAKVAWLAGAMDDSETFWAAMREQRSLDEPRWPPVVRIQGVKNEALACLLKGDFDGALAWKREQVALHVAAGLSDAAPRIDMLGIELTAGRIDALIASARALAERYAATRDPWALAAVWARWSSGLLLKGLTVEARDVMRRNWPLAQAFGRVAAWTDDAALLAALEGRPKAALRLAGFSDASHAAQGSRRGPPRQRGAIHQGLRDRAAQIATAALAATHDAAALGRLAAEGAALAEAEVPVLALQLSDDD